MNPNTQKPPKRVFLATTVVMFFCAFSVADSIDFVPYYIDGTPPGSDSAQDSVALSDLPELGTRAQSATTSPSIPQGVLPERIKIPAIDLDYAIQNPEARSLAALDAAILKSPARYVDSAKLGVPGNMLIFAHSTVYKILRNQAFKAFNRIHELKAGDSISVEGGGVEYLYSVTSVRSENAKDATIDLSPTSGTKLTLTTCDILTGKSARFIVEADFVGVTTPRP